MSDIQKVLFLGSKAFGIAILQTIRQATPRLAWHVMHPDDRQDSRSVLSDFQSYAREHCLPFDISKPSDLVEKILSLKLDIVVVCGYYHILPPAVLDAVPHGFWGIHNSLLPKYRGGAPLVWQIMNGEPMGGSSFFKFSDGMDDGDILHQVSAPITDDTTIATLTAEIEAAWRRELPAKWQDLIEGQAVLSEQDYRAATYCAQRLPEDGMIDWWQTASQIDRFIRAQCAPYPGAFFVYQGQQYVVARHAIRPHIVYGTPGQVFSHQAGYVVVCCGEGSALDVMDVLHQGREMPAVDVIGSIKIRL